MTSKKCPQCGLVNFAEALSCKRCEAALEPSGEVSSEGWPEAEPSGRVNSKLVYVAALGIGLLLTVAYFVFQLMSYASQPSKYFFVVLGVVYGVAASGLIASSRARDWLVALSLSSFYLLYVGVALWSLLERNKTYGGMFWSSKFYLSPVVLIISIPLAAFLGARFGSKRSWLRFAALISVFVVSAAAVPFTEVKARPAKEYNYSTDIVGGESGEFAMRFELTFRIQITDDPWRFRAFPSPPPPSSKSGWQVTVLRKDSTFSPEIKMMINVDGKEVQCTMWPINGANGSSHLDFSQKQDYSEIVNWHVGPNGDLTEALANAHNVVLTWGNVSIVLPDEQVQSLRKFIRDYVRALQKEDMLCTNPMCVQGALNPKGS